MASCWLSRPLRTASALSCHAWKVASACGVAVSMPKASVGPVPMDELEATASAAAEKQRFDAKGLLPTEK